METLALILVLLAVALILADFSRHQEYKELGRDAWRAKHLAAALKKQLPTSNLVRKQLSVLALVVVGFGTMLVMCFIG